LVTNLGEAREGGGGVRESASAVRALGSRERGGRDALVLARLGELAAVGRLPHRDELLPHALGALLGVLELTSATLSLAVLELLDLGLQGQGERT